MVGVLTTQSTKDNYEKLTEQGNTLAIYIEDDDGEYQPNTDNTFPKDGYILNLEKSNCKNGGILSQDLSTKKISLRASTVDQCNVYFEKEKPSLITTIMSKKNVDNTTTYTNGDTKEMYAFTHDALTTTTEYNGTTYTHSATQVANWTSEERIDYRYIGSNPNNYITFNDETWRIIGIFTVETESGSKEQLVKIIRDELIGSLPWDSKGTNNYTNDWSSSILYSLLNGKYYNTGNRFTYTYTASSNKQDTVTISKGLNEKARNQIANVKWYLGGSATYENLGGPDYYAFERGKKTCATEGSECGDGRSTSIIQKVGLMYPSDFIYTYAYGVDNKCYTDGINCDDRTQRAGWLFNSGTVRWTLSPDASNGLRAVYMNSAGKMNTNTVNNNFGVCPSVYLSSGIKITDGDGSEDHPYTIE